MDRGGCFTESGLFVCTVFVFYWIELVECRFLLELVSTIVGKGLEFDI